MIAVTIAGGCGPLHAAGGGEHRGGEWPRCPRLAGPGRGRLFYH